MAVKAGHRNKALQALKGWMPSPGELKRGEVVVGQRAVVTQNHAARLMRIHPLTAGKYLPSPDDYVHGGTYVHIRVPGVVLPLSGN